MEGLASVLAAKLPEGEPGYPEDFLTATPETEWIAEVIREKLLERTREELPFAHAVVVESVRPGEVSQHDSPRAPGDEPVRRGERDEPVRRVPRGDEPVRRVPRGDLTVVPASIVVEREGQKGIVVGKGGTMIREIGTAAREELETELGRRLYLELTVRVEPTGATTTPSVSRLRAEPKQS